MKIKERTEETIDDEHDIQRHILQIHSSELFDVLSNDLILAFLDEKERKYVAEQVVLAHEAKHLIKEPEEREYAMSRLLLKGMVVANLKRNVKGNPLPELLLKKEREMQTMDKEDIDAQLMKKLEKDGKEK